MLGPGLSCITQLSKCLEASSKKVTNLLILLSVLALVILFNYFTGRVLSRVPNRVNDNFVVSYLVIDNVSINDQSSG